MRGLFLFLILGLATFASASPSGNHSSNQEAPSGTQVQTLYGWFDNPTPQNIWLATASVQWLISIQGGYAVKGDWAWPSFPAGQWVQTNSGAYGYGCVLLHGVFDGASRRIVRIESIQGRSLQMCRQKPSLKAKEPYNPFADADNM